PQAAFRKCASISPCLMGFCMRNSALSPGRLTWQRCAIRHLRNRLTSRECIDEPCFLPSEVDSPAPRPGRSARAWTYPGNGDRYRLRDGARPPPVVDVDHRHATIGWAGRLAADLDLVPSRGGCRYLGH